MSTLFVAFNLLGWALVLEADEPRQPLPIAEVKHEGPVDFEKEILPILRRSCLACHSAKVAESDLVLETPKTILQGGAQGPAVVPGKADESLLLNVAVHREEPVMPPAENDKNAPNLTPEELGLIKLWINQGAKGEVSGGAAKIAWQPLPAGFNPIYAVGMAPDGRFAAAARANQIFMYNVASRQELGRLSDPVLAKSGIYNKPGVAHLDLVQSLAFSADGERLASGAFRTVNIWRHPHNVRAGEFARTDGEASSLAISPDRQLAAIGETTGDIQIYEVASGKRVHTLAGHTKAVSGLSFSADGARLASGSFDQTVRFWNMADGQENGRLATPSPVTALVYLLDDSQVAAAGEDNLIRTWAVPAAAPSAAAQPAAAHPIKQMTGHTAPITSLASLTPKGARLMSGSLDGIARVWDSAGGNEVGQYNDSGAITSIAVRPDGKRIVTASEFGRAKLWNAENGQVITELSSDRNLGDELEGLRLGVELAKRRILNAKADYEQTIKEKVAEQEAVYAAVLEAAKTEIEVTKKAAAAVQPLADKQKADEALAKLKMDLEAATAAREKLDEPTAPGTQDEKKQADAVVADVTNKIKAAEQEITKLEETAKKAVSAKDLAEQYYEAAKLAVTRANEAAAKAKAKVPQMQAQYDERKMAEKNAQDQLALAERLLGVHAQRISNLEGKKTTTDKVSRETQAKRLAADGEAAGGLVAMAALAASQLQELEKQHAELKAKLTVAPDESTKDALTKQIEEVIAQRDEAAKKATDISAAAKGAMDAQAAAAAAFVEATAALEAAREAVMSTGMQAQTLVQQTTGMKSMAERDDGEADTRLKAVKAAQELATKELAAAQQKLADAKDEAATTLATAEVANATLKKQAADEDVTQAATARAAVAENKIASEKKLAEVKTQAKQMEDRANQALAAAQVAFDEAQAKLRAADASAGGLQAQLQTALELDAKATAALAEVRQPLRSVCFSPDGVQLAVVGDDQRVRVFSSETGEQLDPISGQGSPLVAAAFVNNSRLLTIARNKTAVIWETLPQWTLERRIGSVNSLEQFVDRVTALSFSPDGKLLATGGGEASRSGELKFWDVETGNLVRAVPSAHSDAILAVEFSPDGKYVATGGADRFMKVFDIATGTLIRSFEGHTQHVLGVSWRADGRLLVTAGADKVTKTWDFNTGEQVRSFPANDKETTAVQYLGASDNFVVSAGDKNVVTRSSNGENGPAFSGSTDYVFSVRASRAGKTVIAGGQDSVVRVWNQQGQLIVNFPPPAAR